MLIGNKIFDTVNCVYLMGILNVTTDSFYDGGKYNTIDKALNHCEQMINEGADIIDVGAQSTRPAFQEIGIEEETQRICDIVSHIKARFDIPISVDTYNYYVANASIGAGADMINDIWGLKHDEGQMAQIISEAGIPCCLMHNRNTKTYNNVIEDVVSDIKFSLNIAINNGICKENIIVDPGIGFAKNYEHNMELIRNLYKIKQAIKLPILLGASNKSFIGKTLDLSANNINGRLEGTLATTAFGVEQGVTFFRVHNVEENKRIIDMMKAILRIN